MSRKKYVYERCPYCENDVKLKALIMKQYCPKCQHLIKPCSLCDPDKTRCNDCPLKNNDVLGEDVSLRALGEVIKKARGLDQ